MGVDRLRRRPGEADRVDDRGVVESVGEDLGLGVAERVQHGVVGVPAGGVGERRFGAEEAGEVGLEVANRVFEVTGASSTTTATGLDLHWRNIRTHSLHDPVDYKRIEVGAHFLNGTVQPVSLYT